MDTQLVQLLGSLIAILALAGIARALKLGRVPGIADKERSMELAREADSAFEPKTALPSADGTAALVADHAGRVMVLRRHGAQFAARILGPGASATRADTILTVNPGDRRFGPVTLDLGDEAQAWESRINALDSCQDA